MVILFILEDEKMTMKMLKTFFKRDEVMRSLISKVYGFTDPLKAVAKYDDLNPGLILLDYMMPNLTGLEFLNAIKWSKDEGPPVILFTAYHNLDSLKDEINRLGIEHIISKPIKLKELTEAIAQVLKN